MAQLIIELPLAIESRVAQAAERKGSTPEEVIQNLVMERYGRQDASEYLPTPAVWDSDFQRR